MNPPSHHFIPPLINQVGNDEEGEETTEIPNTGQEKEAPTKTTEAVKVEPKTETEVPSTMKTQQSQSLPAATESGDCTITKAMANLSVASTSSTTTTTTTTTTSTTTTTTASSKPSVLQRPWADRLLAAARVQHAQQGDNAQAILEDHCSRIWDTSADRTPTSSSGSGGDGLGVSALRPRLDAPGKSPAPIVGTAKQATKRREEEEVDDDCIHPPLLQESSSPPSATTTTTTNSSTRFDFHQQVNESQLVDVTSMRLQARCTSSPAASSTATGGGGGGGGGGGSVGSGGGSGGLVVGYYLCDDPVPYRSQWPSNVITLGQFKHLVPKKGLFRFFFKTTSDEFDSGVVHQEISNDDAVLPLWEGKVVAKVERVEQ
ncbi:unnamed protein product [Hydatigera taeniaeformis]|uniref:DIX domain-containing protein n=1 Tax=Hydatigena taeniaeformis TaxID=6205 RepID=A0A0R3X2J0_HYDTA|nr:unnamed protein product [Hydatigera taeniaeformis]